MDDNLVLVFASSSRDFFDYMENITKVIKEKEKSRDFKIVFFRAMGRVSIDSFIFIYVSNERMLRGTRGQFLVTNNFRGSEKAAELEETFDAKESMGDLICFNLRRLIPESGT